MYLISTTKNTNGLLSFDHDRGTGSELFLETDLSGISFDLRYELKKESNIKKIKSLHLIHSNGPDLVSNRFRLVIEEVAPNQVNFFPVHIACGNEIIEGFSAINMKSSIQCIDLQASEYRKTNFDPINPAYSFLYIKLLDQKTSDFDIGRCEEQPTYIAASDKLKNACLNYNINGLMFCRAIDNTYANRTECQVI